MPSTEISHSSSTSTNIEFRDKLKNRIKQNTPPSKECIFDALENARARREARAKSDGNFRGRGIHLDKETMISSPSAASPSRASSSTSSPHYATPTSASIACRYKKNFDRRDFNQPRNPGIDDSSPSRKIKAYSPMLSEDFEEQRRSKSPWRNDEKYQKKESPLDSKKRNSVESSVPLSDPLNYDASCSQIRDTLQLETNFEQSEDNYATLDSTNLPSPKEADFLEKSKGLVSDSSLASNVSLASLVSRISDDYHNNNVADLNMPQDEIIEFSADNAFSALSSLKERQYDLDKTAWQHFCLEDLISPVTDNPTKAKQKTTPITTRTSNKTYSGAMNSLTPDGILRSASSDSMLSTAASEDWTTASVGSPRHRLPLERLATSRSKERKERDKSSKAAAFATDNFVRIPLSPRQETTDEDSNRPYDVSSEEKDPAESKVQRGLSERLLEHPMRESESHDLSDSEAAAGFQADEENLQSLVANFLQRPDQVRTLLVSHVRRLVKRYEGFSNPKSSDFNENVVGEKQRLIDSSTLASIDKFVTSLAKEDKALANELSQQLSSIIFESTEIASNLGGYRTPTNFSLIEESSSTRESCDETAAASMEVLISNIDSNVLDNIGHFIDSVNNKNIYIANNPEVRHANSGDCLKRSWEVTLSEDEIGVTNVQPKTLDAISRYIDSVTGTEPVTTRAAENDVGNPTINDRGPQTNSVNPVVFQAQNNDLINEQSKVSDFLAASMPVIKDYIVDTLEQDEIERENRAFAVDSHMHGIDFKGVSNQGSGAIGSCIDVLTANEAKKCICDEVDLGPRALLNNEFLEDDSFMSDLKTTSSDSLVFQGKTMHPKALEAIGDYIDTLAATNQFMLEQPLSKTDFVQAGRQTGEEPWKEKMADPASLVVFSDKGSAKGYESNDSEPIQQSESYGDPLIARLRNMKRLDDAVSVAERDDPSAIVQCNSSSSFASNPSKKPIEDPLIERLRFSSTETSKARTTDNVIETIDSSNSRTRHPVDPCDEIQTAQKLARMKQLLGDRRLMIAKDKVEMDGVSSDPLASADLYGNIEINEEAIHAIRDYIDIVNTNSNKSDEKVHCRFRAKRKPQRDPSDASSSTLDRVIDSIALKAAESAGKSLTKPQPEGNTCSNDTDDVVVKDSGEFSYITARIERLETSYNSESRNGEDPPIDLRSLSGEGTIASNDQKILAENPVPESSQQAQDRFLHSFETASQYFLVQPCTPDFQSFSGPFLASSLDGAHMQRRPLSPIFDATDEDSFAQQLSTIPDVTDEDDSTIYSSTQDGPALQQASQSEMPGVSLISSKDEELHCESSGAAAVKDSSWISVNNIKPEVPTSSTLYLEQIIKQLPKNSDVSKATHTTESLCRLVSTTKLPQQTASVPASVEQIIFDLHTSAKDTHSTFESYDPSVRYDGRILHDEEKKDDVPSWGLYTFDSAIRYLFSLLAGSVASSQISQKNFGKLVRFAYPHVRKKQPGAFVVALILSEAQKLNLPLYSVDQFLEINFTLANIKKPLENQHESLDGEEEIIRYIVMLGSIAETMNLMQDELPIRSLLSCSSDDEGIEVDLNEGFVDKRYAPGIDGETTQRSNDFSKGVSVKINVPSSIPLVSSLLSIPQQGSSKVSFKHSTNRNDRNDDRSVNEEINRYWNARTEKHSDRKQKHPTTMGRKPRHSVEDIGSLFSASTGTSFGSHSHTVDSEDEDRWKLNGTMARLLQRSKKNKPQQTASFFQHCRLTTIDSHSISAVHAASSLLEDAYSIKSINPPLPQVWKLSYLDRTEPHQGYFDIDVYSLYDSCKVNRRGHALDGKPWELRPVNQRFLDEQSLSFSRNWFGSIAKTNGNSKIKYRACRVKSMEMPTRAEEWTKDWYDKQWAAPLPSNVSGTTSSGLEVLSDEQKEIEPYGTPLSRMDRNCTHKGKSHDSNEESLWEDIPECGKLRNVLVKPGERISRLSPNFTCYLRRSRWRKKHFPRGSCPYK